MKAWLLEGLGGLKKLMLGEIPGARYMTLTFQMPSACSDKAPDSPHTSPEGSPNPWRTA